MKRKWTAMLLVGMMTLSLTACGADNDTQEDTGSGKAGVVQTEETKAENTDDINRSGAENTEIPEMESAQTSGSNILIAYFAVAENSEVDAVSSASVVTIDGETKGTIKALADMIQSRTGGELFSIQTSVDYPADCDKLIEYAAGEQDEDARPKLTSHMEQFQEAEVVFIGYPVWWYTLPQVMYSFFDEYDFSGKTIVPFCTHNGSRFSGTIETIQELEPQATVIEDGFTVNERDVEDAEADVNAWLEKLGY